MPPSRRGRGRTLTPLNRVLGCVDQASFRRFRRDDSSDQNIIPWILLWANPISAFAPGTSIFWGDTSNLNSCTFKNKQKGKGKKSTHKLTKTLFLEKICRNSAKKNWLPSTPQGRSRPPPQQVAGAISAAI